MRVGMESLDLVNSIMRHETVYPYMTDDYSPPREDFTMADFLQSPHIYTLMPNKMSVFLFHPHNGVLYEVHTAVLPEGRGKAAVEGACAARDWMFTNTRCRKIMTVIPSYNRGAYALARRVGMAQEGIMTKAFLKHGQLVDLAVFTIGKEA